MNPNNVVPQGSYLLIKLVPEPEADSLLNKAVVIRLGECLLFNNTLNAPEGASILVRSRTGLEFSHEDSRFALVHVDDIVGWHTDEVPDETPNLRCPSCHCLLEIDVQEHVTLKYVQTDETPKGGGGITPFGRRTDG
jgi:hypothetical protein